MSDTLPTLDEADFKAWLEAKVAENPDQLIGDPNEPCGCLMHRWQTERGVPQLSFGIAYFQWNSTSERDDRRLLPGWAQDFTKASISVRDALAKELNRDVEDYDVDTDVHHHPLTARTGLHVLTHMQQIIEAIDDDGSDIDGDGWINY